MKNLQIIIAENTIDPTQLLNMFSQQAVETGNVGAVASFSGYVRAENNKVNALELSHYPDFTQSMIDEFGQIAIKQFDLTSALIVHRVGKIYPSEPIVFVATAAVHRRQAFEGVDYLMDYLKSKAPFWKKEIYFDQAIWVEPREDDYADIARWDDHK